MKTSLLLFSVQLLEYHRSSHAPFGMPTLCKKKKTSPLPVNLFITNTLNLLSVTVTCLQETDSAFSASLTHEGLLWTRSPRPGRQKGGKIRILLCPESNFQVLHSPPSLSLSFKAHCVHPFSLRKFP